MKKLIAFLLLSGFILCGCEELPMTDLYYQVFNKPGTKLETSEYYWLGKNLIEVTHKDEDLWLYNDSLGGELLNASPLKKAYRLSNGKYVGLLPYGDLYREFSTLEKKVD